MPTSCSFRRRSWVVSLIVAFFYLFYPSALIGQELEVAKLIEKLTKDESAQQRRSAARALGDLGKRGLMAIPALVRALEDPDSGVRDEAENALIKFGEAAVPEVLPRLKDPDEFVRLRAVSVLGRIGPDAKAALADVEMAKSDSSQFVRNAAVEAEFRIRVEAKSLVPLFKDKDEEKRLYAVRACGYLGPLAKPVLPELSQALRTDKSKEVRREAAKSLAKLGREARDAVPALTAALNDADDTVKIYSLHALAEIGPDARSALPLIDRVGKAAQRSRNEELYDAAMRAWNVLQPRRPGR
ncbi:MAG: HEAT repeat domain-containing protein [Gemmatales bacterium]|nr:HEAT repeat domain-containing protein [Gemmatales bacterium]MDW8387985.1 HEAT repeat domain-containing protein [Gemmatales bacterium]